jgi:hypothetical protein
MKIYRLTDVGEGEANTPDPSPSSAKKVLYYLRRRPNWSATSDMIASNVYGGDVNKSQVDLSRLVRANAIKAVE